MYNNGFAPEARRLAARMIRVFESSDKVVSVSGSCVAMVRDVFPRLFAEDASYAGRGMAAAARALAARTFEFAEFLEKELAFDPRAAGVRFDQAAGATRVTAHRACHLRAIGASYHAEHILSLVPGIEYAPLSTPDQCCGFGGTFATKYPDISAAMARDKASDIRATGAGTLLCGEPGCAMNITGMCRREGFEPRVLSLPELLAEGLGLMANGSGSVAALPPRRGKEAQP
jgi:L-lactate dehydrogenase complex protein LldE